MNWIRGKKVVFLYLYFVDTTLHILFFEESRIKMKRKSAGHGG